MPSILNATTTSGLVTSADNSGSLQLQTNNGTTAVTIDTSQNVGIGTSSPSSRLDVRAANIAVGQNDCFVQFRTTTAQAANVGASLQLGGMYDGSNSLGFAEIAGRKENSTSGNWSGYLQFATRQFGGSFEERMRIDSSGNVGIGTTTPLYTFANRGSLTINGTSQAVLALSSGSSTSTSAYHIWDGTNYSINNQNTTGYLSFGTNAATERMRITSGGNLLVGTTAAVGPARVVAVQATAGEAGFGCYHSLGAGETLIAFANAANTAIIGTIKNNGNTAVSYNTTSDYRLKENVSPMTGALAKVAQLKPVTYTWKETGNFSQGFIAHELQEVVPDAVSGEKDAVDAEGNPVYQGVDTSFLVATLTAAIQELKAELDATKAEVQALKGAQ